MSGPQRLSTHFGFTSNLFIRARDYGQWTIKLSVIWNLKRIRKRSTRRQYITLLNTIWDCSMYHTYYKPLSQYASRSISLVMCRRRYCLSSLTSQEYSLRNFATTALVGTSYLINSRRQFFLFSHELQSWPYNGVIEQITNWDYFNYNFTLQA